uniref:NADH dehydrogenase [ubiquinone] 1 beta subcomplex subunit 1 n=1 Tax=Aotus nancymaae TaxID=37293 RepID=A0A2K5CDW1_AOTNA
MVNLLHTVRDHWVHVLVPVKNDEKLTALRNKSMLYKRELRPIEEYTWK